MKHTMEELKEIAYKTRKRFLELFTEIGFGHLTSAFSWTEIAVVLYYEIMKLSDNPFIDTKDYMVVSKGHGCGILFPIFEDKGWISRTEMKNILSARGDKQKLKKLFSPGFDFFGGSLGIGFGMACGIAKGNALKNVSHKTYCILGDAECCEGSVWEASIFAASQNLGNLIAIVDRNGLGCSDFTENMVRLEPFEEKWKSFGWEVQKVDGHNIEELYDALFIASSSEENKPHCIIANTKKGKGLDYTVDIPLLHGYMPKSERDIKKAFKELKYV